MIFPSVRLLRQAAAVIRRQQKEIARLHAEVRAAELTYMRIARDMLEQFLIVLDLPEEQDEIRERMTTSLGFYRDEIAVREEHV
jgi:2C-methyl-D-erythritol 2,4-cyclodiphosphate synthase